MNTSHDNWNYQSTDDYAGEILPEALVKNAIIDELDHFNANDWRVDTLEQAKQIPDRMSVRSRWVAQLLTKGIPAKQTSGLATLFVR